MSQRTLNVRVVSVVLPLVLLLNLVQPMMATVREDIAAPQGGLSRGLRDYMIGELRGLHDSAVSEGRLRGSHLRSIASHMRLLAALANGTGVEARVRELIKRQGISVVLEQASNAPTHRGFGDLRERLGLSASAAKGVLARLSAGPLLEDRKEILTRLVEGGIEETFLRTAREAEQWAEVLDRGPEDTDITPACGPMLDGSRSETEPGLCSWLLETSLGLFALSDMYWFGWLAFGGNYEYYMSWACFDSACVYMALFNELCMWMT